MSEKLELKCNKEFYHSGDPIELELLVHDRELIGCDAKLELICAVSVSYSRGVAKSTTDYKEAFKIRESERKFYISPGVFDRYRYKGDRITIGTFAKVTVNDGVLIDTQQTCVIPMEFRNKPPANASAKEIIDPKDRHSFFQNLAVLPGSKAVKVMIELLFAIAILAGAYYIVYNDIIAKDPADTILFTMNDESRAVIIVTAGIVFTACFMAFMYALLLNQLRGYLSVKDIPVTRSIARGKSFCIADFIKGRVLIPLDNLVVRMVAANIEGGEYYEGSGDKRRRTAFRNPARGIIIYEKKLPNLRAGQSIENYLREQFQFDAMFDLLYPNCWMDNTHGFGLIWQVQFIHDKLIDCKVYLPGEKFSSKAFIYQGS